MAETPTSSRLSRAFLAYDWLVFLLSVILLVVLGSVCFLWPAFWPYEQNEHPKWWAFQSLVVNVSLNLIAGIIAFDAVYLLLRRFQALKDEEDEERIATRVSNQVSTGVISLLQDFRQSNDLLKDAIEQINGIKISEHTPLYKLLKKEYAWPRGKDGANGCERTRELFAPRVDSVSTNDVVKEYKSRVATASSYLCVIYAHKESAFISGDLSTWIKYFADFYVGGHDRDRITRVFSISAEFSDGNVKLLHEMEANHRMRLFQLLLLNWAVEVDTKLHLFNPNASSNDDFFQTADYVLCYDPCSESPDQREIIYIALPQNEAECYKICNKPLAYALYQYEFFRRLSGVAVDGAEEKIIDLDKITTYPSDPEVSKLATCLQLQPSESNAAILQLMACIESCSDKNWYQHVKKKLDGGKPPPLTS